LVVEVAMTNLIEWSLST